MLLVQQIKENQKDGRKQSIYLHCRRPHACLSSVPIRFLHSRWERAAVQSWKSIVASGKIPERKRENACTCTCIRASISFSFLIEEPDRRCTSMSESGLSLSLFPYVESLLRSDFASRKLLIDGFCAVKFPWHIVVASRVSSPRYIAVELDTLTNTCKMWRTVY